MGRSDYGIFLRSHLHHDSCTVLPADASGRASLGYSFRGHSHRDMEAYQEVRRVAQVGVIDALGTQSIGKTARKSGLVCCKAYKTYMKLFKWIGLEEPRCLNGDGGCIAEAENPPKNPQRFGWVGFASEYRFGETFSARVSLNASG